MSKPKTKTISGASLIVLSSFFYASYGIWTKLTGDYFGGYSASAIRSVLVVLMLLPIMFIIKKFEPLRLKENIKNILGMVFFSFFIWGPLYYATLHAGIGVALSVNYACLMLSTLVFARIFKSEKLTKSKMISVVLGLLGLSLYFLPGGGSYSWLGVVAAVVSGVGSGGNIVFTSKLPYNPLQTSIVAWTTSVFANIILVMILSESIPQPRIDTHWLYMVMFAVASVLASWTFIWGLKSIEAGIAGILGLLEIVFGIIFGLAFFNEKLTGTIVAGAILILLAAAYPYLSTKLKTQRLDT